MNDDEIRVFFALWPDALTRRKIFRTYHSIQALAGSGRPVKIQNLHLTLHFIGNIPTQKLPCLIEAGDRVAAKPFSLKLTACGSFRRPQVAWLGCSVYPLQLSELHHQLGVNLQVCDYRPEERGFRPHVTMARKIRENVDNHPFDVIRWRVNRFVLLQSISVDGGVMYRVRHSWSLPG